MSLASHDTLPADVWVAILVAGDFDLRQLHAFQQTCREACRIIRANPSLFWFKHPPKRYRTTLVQCQPKAHEHLHSLLIMGRDTLRFQFHDTMPRVQLLVREVRLEAEIYNERDDDV